MLFKYKTKSGSGEVQADSARAAASKILMDEPIRYCGKGNYYMPPMIFCGALSRVEIKLWLVDKIRHSQGLVILSPKELKNRRRWL